MVKRLTMNTSIANRYTNLIALGLGCLLTLSFAPFDIFPLAILAPAGLIYLIHQEEPDKAAKLGFMFGLGLFGSGVYWVFISIHQFGQVPSIISAIITLALVALLSLYTSLTCFLSNRYFKAKDPTNVGLAFASIWVIIEFFRSFMFTGFPWLLLGYSQVSSPLKGYAPLFSVYGVSFFALVSSTLIINAYLKYRANDNRGLYWQLYSLLAIWLLGAALSFIPWTQTTGKPLKVSLVQGNIEQSTKWSPDHIQQSIDRYINLTKPLWKNSDIIVWPEAAIPKSLQATTDTINELDMIARSTNTQLVLGIPVLTADSTGAYNTIVTIGKNLAVYKKRLLVPFGEYVPLKTYLGSALDLIHVPLPNLVAATKQQKPFILHGVKVLPTICYEVAFPFLLQTRDPELGVLLTVTNDAWFGHSIAQAQHLQMAQMRSIELGRPTLFVGNDGITSIIAPNGKIEDSAEPYKTAVLQGSVQPVYGITPWMYNGMDPILFLILCILISNKLGFSVKKILQKPDTVLTSE